MPKSKFIRMAAALLMILAMVLPMSPGYAAEQVEDATISAYNIPDGNCGPIQGVTPAPLPAGCTAQAAGGPVGTVVGQNTGSLPGSFFFVAQRNDATYDKADCPAVNETTGTPAVGGGIFAPNVGMARYVVSVVSDTIGLFNAPLTTASTAQIEGLPQLTTAVIYLIGVGTNNAGTVFQFSAAADREPSAFDGIDEGNIPQPGPFTFDGLCVSNRDVPRDVIDGKVNDYESQFVKSHSGTVAGTSSEQHLWNMLVTAPGHQSVLVSLAAVTDDLGDTPNGAISTRGLPGFPLTNVDPLCGIDTFACNIGLGTIALPLIGIQQGFGNVTGTVFAANGLPLANVTVVLTDSRGTVYTALTGPGGFYAFTGVFPGPGVLVYADNVNDYGTAVNAGAVGAAFGPATGCAPGSQCGHLPAFQNVTVGNSTNVNQVVTLQPKFAPTAAEATPAAGSVGVFGYVVTSTGTCAAVLPGVPCGVGNVTITAAPCTAAGAPVAGCLAPPAGITGATPLPVVSAFGTGRWFMTGLTPGVTYTFTATYTGASAATNALACATPVVGGVAATPTLTVAGGTCTDIVTMPVGAGATGTWADPVFVLIAPPAQAIVNPPQSVGGFGFITGTVRDSTGLPVAGTLVTIFQISTGLTFATTTSGAGQFGFFGPAVAGGACVGTGTAGAVLPGSGCVGLAPDTYTVTVVDTRFPVVCAPGFIGGAVAQPVCGGLPASTTVTLGPNQILNAVNTPLLAFVLRDKIAPGSAPGALAGVFGYVVESGSGFPVGGGSIVNPATFTIGGPFITFTPVGAAFAAVTVGTDVNGRFEALLAPGVAYTAAITLPPGFTGACTVGIGTVVAVPATCTNAAGTGFTAFTIAGAAPAAAGTFGPLTAGTWNDGASWVLASTVTSFPPIGTTSEALQAVASPIFRNPDTSFTGVDLETVQLRVMNNGPIRTGVRVDWWQTASDETVSLAKSDSFDLNPAAVAIFTRSFVPDGCTRCFAEIYSVDRDAQGLAMGLADLQAVVTTRVVEADNAIAGSNAMSNEDLFGSGQVQLAPGIPTQTTITLPNGGTYTVLNCIPGAAGCPGSVNEQYNLPVVFKNYGGGAHKWNSVITACMTRQIGVPGFTGLGGQPLVFIFSPLDQTNTPNAISNGPSTVTRSVNPGGCSVINLGTGDPDDPELGGIGGLANGAYNVFLQSTGGILIPLPINNTAGAGNRQGAFFGSTINYTITGKMATAFNGAIGSAQEGAVAGIRQVYAGLVFKRYNDWNTGIIIAHPGNATNMDTTLTFYGEDGTVIGTYFDRINNQVSRAYYLPTIPIQIPDGFRGTAIIAGVATNNVALFPGFAGAGTSRIFAGAHNVNYERNQATSYNLTREDSIALPTAANQARFVNPCINAALLVPGQVGPGPVGAINPLLPAAAQLPGTLRSCLAVPALERSVARGPGGATFEPPNGPNTGIRLYHPDADRTGRPAVVDIFYVNAAGVVADESLTRLTIPAFGTATVFVGADTRMFDFFTGTAVVTSDVPLVGIGQVVDYSVNTRDGSWAYNLPNQRGFTQ